MQCFLKGFRHQSETIIAYDYYPLCKIDRLFYRLKIDLVYFSKKDYKREPSKILFSRNIEKRNGHCFIQSSDHSADLIITSNRLYSSQRGAAQLSSKNFLRRKTTCQNRKVMKKPAECTPELVLEKPVYDSLLLQISFRETNSRRLYGSVFFTRKDCTFCTTPNTINLCKRRIDVVDQGISLS